VSRILFLVTLRLREKDYPRYILDKRLGQFKHIQNVASRKCTQTYKKVIYISMPPVVDILSCNNLLYELANSA